MTIPKSAITYGNNPVVYIDGQQALNQNFTQDQNYYYVWYTTEFSTHQVIIQFTELKTPVSLSFIIAIIVVNVAVVISIVAVLVVKRRMQI